MADETKSVEVADEDEKQNKNDSANVKVQAKTAKKDAITVDDVKQDEKNEPPPEKFKKYFAITAERRTRFQSILQKMDEFKFKLNTTSILEFTSDKKKFQVVTRTSNAKCFHGEPLVWYLETIMPGKPDTFMQYWGESQYRLKWDPQISSHNKMELWHQNDEKTFLHVVNYQTKPQVGGLVSPRQFTTLVQRWKLANDGLELAAQSTNYKDFPAQKGLVDAWNTLYGQLITVIDGKELKEKYGVPEMEVMDGDEKGVLGWCKCQYVIQTDIKGWLPKSVVGAAVGGGSMSTFDNCRMYLLKDVFGLKVDVKKIK